MRSVARTILTRIVLCLTLFAPVTAFAEEAVTLSHDGMTLNGRVVLADGKTLADGAVLIVHGTLAHNGMEIIDTFQTALAERELSSLAITLSLGVDGRSGMYDCAVPHRHKHTDALDEIAAWTGWLKEKGAATIALMGHSRGGNQVAWYAAERDDPSVQKLVLVAPSTWTVEREGAGYEKNNGVSLAAVIDNARQRVDAGQGAELMEKTGILYCPGAQVSAESFLSYHAPDKRRHTPHLLPSLKVPALVIAGTEDTVVGDLPAAIEPIADGDKITLTVVDGADHFFLDFFAEDAADAIAEFLSE